MPHSRSAHSRALPLALAAALSACGGGDGPTGPTAGVLEITTSTYGVEPDGNGYTLQLDDQPAQTIGTDATVRKEGEAGNHSVQLGGVAENCTVSTQNPRSVSITPGETTTIAFTVTCVATTGELQVTTATTGPAPDPDGYIIILDGAERGQLGPSGGANVDGLAPGDHTVGLSGVVGNCEVQGSNPRTVTVPPGERATAAFAVACAAPPASVGTLRIITTTAGPDPDPDGYTVAVDDAAGQPIGLSATATVANVEAGSHNVRLAGVAANCTVQESNPRPVTVQADATAEIAFAVACNATTGGIQLSVTTAGTPPDPDGYLATLDGGPVQSLGVSGSGTFSGVAPGSHTVTLTGVAGNCLVADGVSRSVNVAAGANAELAFAVNCTDATGSIRVTVATTGASPDADGYAVSLNGGAGPSLPTSGEVVIADLAPGQHSLALTGVASNCDVEGDNPRVADVTAGATADATFAVVCQINTSLRWVPMDGTGDDVWGTGPSDVFAVTGYGDEDGPTVMHYDGQGWTEQFRPAEGYDLEAVWASGPGDVYVAGNNFGSVNGSYIGYAPIFHYDGSTWTEAARFLPEPFADRAIFYGLWGASATDIFAVGGHELEKGYRSLIAHYDGQEWTTMTSPEAEARLFDVWGTSGSDVFAVGVKSYFNPVGVVLHYDGTAWSKVLELPVGTQALGVWGSSPTDVFVVGPKSSVMHYNGSGWSSIPAPISAAIQLFEVWGTSATDVYAVGSNTVTGREGIILHYDGDEWRQQTSGTSAPLYGVWGSSPSDVFVTGGGLILHGTP